MIRMLFTGETDDYSQSFMVCYLFYHIILHCIAHIGYYGSTLVINRSELYFGEVIIIMAKSYNFIEGFGKKQQ